FALPTLMDPVTVDGYSQPGAQPNTQSVGNNAVLQIELDGSLAGFADGLFFETSDCLVRGLVINRFGGSGLYLNNSPNNVIEGNFIGTDVTGTYGFTIDSPGIWLFGSATGNTIGGTHPAARNLISGYAEGI